MSGTTFTAHDLTLAPARSDGPHLLVLGVDALEAVPLVAGAPVYVGRADNCDVVVKDESASRRHLRFVFERLDSGAGALVEDLGSSNGSRLNGRRLAAGVPEPVRDGEYVELGATRIIVRKGPYFPVRRRLLPFPALEAVLNDACARSADSGAPVAFVRWELSEPMHWYALAAEVASSLPPPHLFAAYGDKQHVAVLFGVDAENAEAIARAVALTLSTTGSPGAFGIASAPRDGITTEQLMARSNEALVRRNGLHSISIAVEGPKMQRARDLAAKAAGSDLSVLLLGETGVGKDVMARYIHERSPRRQRPLLSLNCAGMSETLIASELFGHEKGAFTGATSAKRGLFETADGGTVFLDEVGELPLTVQATLLRVLETGDILPVGGLRQRHVDVRFIAATNRALDVERQQGRFRSDLFYRLAGIEISIPALRERRDEIPGLCQHFMEAACAASKRRIGLALAAQQRLLDYAWPGNIRELRNMMERAVVLCDGDEIGLEHLPQEKFGHHDEQRPLASSPGQLTRERLIELLTQNGWNQTRTAESLKISRKTLIERMVRFQIARPQKGSSRSGA